jgi:quinol monooxygenase YgiN
MKYVLIIHEVEVYLKWKTIFDEASKIRKEAGELSYQVLRYENQPNTIVHFSEWSSHESAKRFFESPELVKIRKDAGVAQPQFIYLEELDRGQL